MSLSRRETSALRAVMVFGAIGIIAFHLYARWLTGELPSKAERYDLILRNNMANYPDWIANGNLLLNMAFSYLLMLFVAWLVYNQSRRLDTAEQYLLNLVIVGMSFAALTFGVIISAMSGWYAGMQSAAFGAVFVLTLFGAIAFCYGVYWAITNAYEAYVKWWFEPRFKHIVSPINSWFNAEDVPSDSDNGPV